MKKILSLLISSTLMLANAAEEVSVSAFSPGAASFTPGEEPNVFLGNVTNSSTSKIWFFLPDGIRLEYKTENGWKLAPIAPGARDFPSIGKLVMVRPGEKDTLTIRTTDHLIPENTPIRVVLHLSDLKTAKVLRSVASPEINITKLGANEAAQTTASPPSGLRR